MPPAAAEVLASREGATRTPQPDRVAGGLAEWLAQYAAKAWGGAVHMPEPGNPRDAFVTWGGTFAAIALAELVFNAMNGSLRWRGEVEAVI